MDMVLSWVQCLKKKPRCDLCYTLMIMLPDNMFLNLIDMDLQQKITMTDDLDGSAAKALKLLLEIAPTSMTKGLEDWKLKQQIDKTFFSSKERTIYQEIWTYNKK